MFEVLCMNAVTCELRMLYMVRASDRRTRILSQWPTASRMVVMYQSLGYSIRQFFVRNISQLPALLCRTIVRSVRRIYVEE